MKKNIPVEVFYLKHDGFHWWDIRQFFHKHQWVPLKEHPRGGEVAFCFMLESEESAQVEMCITCLARRVKESSK